MNPPRKGEIPFKQWAAEAARQTGLTPEAMALRYRQGKIPLRVRRVNQRVIYVRTHRPATAPEGEAKHVADSELVAALRKAAQ